MIQKAVQVYVDLCKDLCVEISDYGNKVKLKKHNHSIVLLRKYADELTMKPYGQQVFEELLCHQNIVVRTTAAADCLRLNIHKEKAIIILENALNCNNSIVSLNARMTLKTMFPSN